MVASGYSSVSFTNTATNELATNASTEGFQPPFSCVCFTSYGRWYRSTLTTQVKLMFGSEGGGRGMGRGRGRASSCLPADLQVRSLVLQELTIASQGTMWDTWQCAANFLNLLTHPDLFICADFSLRRSGWVVPCPVLSWLLTTCCTTEAKPKDCKT